jgi:hypothetical protein
MREEKTAFGEGALHYFEIHFLPSGSSASSRGAVANGMVSLVSARFRTYFCRSLGFLDTSYFLHICRQEYFFSGAMLGVNASQTPIF